MDKKQKNVMRARWWKDLSLTPTTKKIFFFRQWKWKKDEGWVVRGGVPTDNVFCKKEKFSHHLPEHSVGMHINFPSHTTQKNEILRRKKKSNKREMNLQNKKTQGFYNLKKCGGVSQLIQVIIDWKKKAP